MKRMGGENVTSDGYVRHAQGRKDVDAPKREVRRMCSPNDTRAA